MMLHNKYLLTASAFVLGIALWFGVAFLLEPQAPFDPSDNGVLHTASQQAQGPQDEALLQLPGEAASGKLRSVPDTTRREDDAGTDRSMVMESELPELAEESAASAEANLVQESAFTELHETGAEAILTEHEESLKDDQSSNSSAEGILSLEGRVLTSEGRSVQGIDIFARLYERSANQSESGELSTTSNEEGGYHFEGLQDGLYQLRTQATEQFPMATMMVRAGLKSADIVLNEILTVSLAGRVADKEGQGLAEVNINVFGQSQGIRTGKEGFYNFPLKVQSNLNYTFQFKRDGFHENRITRNGAELAAAASLRMDVQLERTGNTTNIDGVIKSEHGDPLGGQYVFLQSPSLNARYQAISDKEGNFTLQGVALGTDYRVSVSPSDIYGQYQLSPVEIIQNMPLLEIYLPVLDGGSVSGHVVDAEGAPMSNFTLFMRSEKSSHSSRAVTDENGYFEPVELAAGKVTFFTQAQPRFNVSGLDLQADNQQMVRLQIDWGTYDMRGSVVEDSGTAIGGARVSMSMSYRFDNLSASSLRSTITDAGGFFYFSQVGPGMHRISVNEDGYKLYSTEYDVGGVGSDEFKVELETK